MRICIVEDELLTANELSTAIGELGYELAGVATNYTDALNIIKNTAPGLVLLDINLTGTKSGIDVALALKKEYRIPHIFLSSHADPVTVTQAGSTLPYGYLVKPVTRDALYAAMETAILMFRKDFHNTSDVGYFVKEKNTFKKVNLHNLQYIMSEGNYIELFFSNNTTCVLRKKLDEFHQNFSHLDLFRLSRRYLINPKAITQVNEDSIVVANTEVPLSANSRANLIQRMKIL